MSIMHAEKESPYMLMTKRQTQNGKVAFTFPPYQQHLKCLPPDCTSSRNPLDYWVCVTEKHSPLLTTCKKIEDDIIHQNIYLACRADITSFHENSNECILIFTGEGYCHWCVL